MRVIKPTYRKAIKKHGTMIKELEWALRYLLGRTEKPTRNSINEPVRQLLAKKVAAEKPQKVLKKC